MDKNSLIEEIKTAFKNVTLEDGIGLREGDGIDDYRSQKELVTLRRQDEKENWQAIPFEDICGKYECAFTYFDAKGMRFHLPQYLIADILWEQLTATDIHLSYDPEWTLDRMENGVFELFNTQQIQAVIHYLEYKIHLEIEENKKYGVTDANNQALYEKSTTLQKWKRFFDDKTQGFKQ